MPLYYLTISLCQSNNVVKTVPCRYIKKLIWFGLDFLVNILKSMSFNKI
ncbi:hypothetical protein Pint_16611 [Pistacia integerrima]|uniref:Uncharacterized protein n=1 Tax=Pistacia integerrima TaxID=434235 RepID=A0ACC0ZCZ8_9ROSI|nr:hypothetical protein Pint_16611 [Pistacia integerrima]